MSQEVVSNIDLNGVVNGCSYFKWSELLFLNDWDVFVFPTPSQYNNILNFMPQIEKVRTFLGVKMIVTSMLRPREYNKQIKGSRKSLHMEGRAIDFMCTDLDLNTIKLKPKLEEFNLRMEDHNGNWIHLDNALPGKTGRFFKP